MARQMKLIPEPKFQPNPPKICAVFGTDHNYHREFVDQPITNPEYQGPPPPPIVMLVCDCGDAQPLDLVKQ